MTPHTICLNRPDDERLEILVNGESVGDFDHDRHGWSGMEAAEDLATAIAGKLGIPLIETAVDGEDRPAAPCARAPVPDLSGDRELFEAWALTQPYFGYAAGDLAAIDRDGDGYSDACVHAAFCGYSIRPRAA
jgi:hypothetical protein